VARFKHLETAETHVNSIHEEISSRLNSGHACYHSVQSLLSSLLLSKNIKIKIDEIIILLVLLHEFQSFTLTLGEEHRLRVCDDSVITKFGPNSEKVAGGWRRLHNEELHNFYASPNMIRVTKLR
jgi:hypothetical protein